ncbi:MAG: universal stress protein [Pseudomonadota bacterium]
MKQINKILLCSHPEVLNLVIVDHAAELAINSQAEIKVFHVIGGYPKDLKEWWNVRNPEKLRKTIQDKREAFVAGVVERLREKGVEKVSSEIRWGKEFVETTREVIRNGHDLVMLTARDMGELKKRVFECPSHDLFLNCPCTLWIAKQGSVTKRTKRVLASFPGEGSHIDLVCDGLSAKILENAAAVAALESSELHIVHALPKYGAKGIKKGRKVRPDLTEFVDELRTKLKESCNPLLNHYGLTLKQKQFHLLIGHPAEVIPEFVNELGVDLIVLGTAARSGLQGLIYGNTAEKVLKEINCSIMAVKPDDFVSPVKLADSDT